MMRRSGDFKDYLLGVCGVIILFLAVFVFKVADDYIKPDSHIVSEFSDITVESVTSTDDTSLETEPKIVLLADENAGDNNETFAEDNVKTTNSNETTAAQSVETEVQTTDSVMAAETTVNGMITTDTYIIEYVLNTNTHKFHLPSCTSVVDIKDKNKAYLYDRNQIITDGYVPCKRCNP